MRHAAKPITSKSSRGLLAKYGGSLTATMRATWHVHFRRTAPRAENRMGESGTAKICLEAAFGE